VPKALVWERKACVRRGCGVRMPPPLAPRWWLVLATLAALTPQAAATYYSNESFAERNRRMMTDLNYETVIISNQVCLLDASNAGAGATLCQNDDLKDAQQGLAAVCSPQRTKQLQILFDTNMDIGHNNLGAVGNSDDQAKHDAAEGTDGIKSYGVNRAPASTACAKCGGTKMNEGPCANSDNQNHGEYEWIKISCELWVGHPWFDAWAEPMRRPMVSTRGSTHGSTRFAGGGRAGNEDIFLGV